MRPRAHRSRLIAPVVVVLSTALLLLGLTAAPASALPRHQIDASITRVTNHRFVVHGTVTLTDHRFQVLKRRAHTQRYVPLEQPRTHGRGRFRFTVTGDPGDCFEMVLPATRQRRTTVVSLGCIHRVR